METENEFPEMAEKEGWPKSQEESGFETEHEDLDVPSKKQLTLQKKKKKILKPCATFYRQHGNMSGFLWQR